MVRFSILFTFNMANKYHFPESQPPQVKIYVAVLCLIIGIFLSDSSLVELAKKVNLTLLSGMKVKARSRERTLVFGSVL